MRDAKDYTPYQIAARGGAIHRALDRAGGHDLGCDRKDQQVADSGAGEARVMHARTRSNVRSGPGTRHGEVGLLEAGQKVRVIGETGDWLRIEMPGGGEAFVYGPLLVETPAATVQGQEPARQDTASATSAPAATPSVTQQAEPTAPVGAQNIPDQATRERVAEGSDLSSPGR